MNYSVGMVKKGKEQGWDKIKQARILSEGTGTCIDHLSLHTGCMWD